MKQLVLAVMLASVGAIDVASAQTIDSSTTRTTIDESLASALSSHEAQIRSLGESLSESLAQKIEFAKSRGDLDLLEKAEAELDAFLTSGKLPTLVRTASYERSVLGIQRKMLRDYDDAISAFVKAGLIDDAKLIRKQKSDLERRIDDPLLGPFIGQQLLTNGGCEKVLPNGRPLGWASLSGNWTQRRDNPKPASGESYFFAGAGREGQIFQLVDLQPIAKYVDGNKIRFRFTAQLRSYGGRPPDTAEAFVEFWNDKPEMMISSQTTGPVTSERNWEEKRIEGTIPAGTAYVRIRLVSTRRDGTNNDGYFDDVALRLELAE